MNRTLRAIAQVIINRDRWLLLVMMVGFVLLFTGLSWWKYAIFAYEGLDLAIFNQVFWNTLNGHFFEQSIHPHLSLGDHAGLIIPVLLPFYGLWPGPRILLLLQALALALPAWPLFLIAKRRIAGHMNSPGLFLGLTPLILAASWLIYPAVHNVAMFEFHLLPFALLPLFFALLAYEQGRKSRFLLFAAIALLVREDVGLVVAAIGLLAWMERRTLWWRLVPAVLGLGWFAAALRLISHFAPEGGYKFLVYYSWLGETPAEIALSPFLKPLTIIRHLLTVPNLEMILGFGLPLLFLPYLKPKRLVLLIGPLAQILLGAPGGGALILETHYATLFLPAIFFAASEAIVSVPKMLTGRSRTLTLREMLGVVIVCYALAGIYSALLLGPVLPAAARIADPAEDRIRARTAERMIELIPSSSSVAASYALLPHLSSRRNLHSLHYLFLGVTQFATHGYPPPDGLRFVALDTRDLITYQAQFPKTSWAAPHYAGGYDRLAAVLGQDIFGQDTFMLYDQAAEAPPQAPLPLSRNALAFTNGIKLHSPEVTLLQDEPTGDPLLLIAATWSAVRESDREPVMRLSIHDRDGQTVRERLMPLMNLPVPTAGLAGTPQRPVIRLPLSGLPPGDYVPQITLQEIDAKLVLDGIRSHRLQIDRTRNFGTVTLPAFVLK
ncbi:hypothetical protein AMJ57_04380 [Parcubacteria bacterium SG8_24]|nr:MAG: hypothetical protein AMJ57_04380 [Parcubacteria bacterium SG8_24]